MGIGDAPKFIQGIDWAEFKQQRKVLYRLSNDERLTEKDRAGIDGIIALCDGLTDYAILLDGIITRICADMEILEGQANSWA